MTIFVAIAQYIVACGLVLFLACDLYSYFWDYSVARKRYGYKRTNSALYAWACAEVWEKILTICIILLIIGAWVPIIFR